MREKYIDHNFREASLEIVNQANNIIDEYLAEGYKITLRQLYYQFVSRDLLANKQESYNKLGTIISKGRLSGLIDWAAIEDRTRTPKENSHWDSPADIIEACAQSYRINTRATQDEYVEVWVEKEALAGVIERTARDLDVLSFACRGYVSQTAMWEAARRILIQEDLGKTITILHLGDHDPSGIDMTRDIQDRLNMFGTEVNVDRIALNMPQIENYNPPPNPAKLTDSRCGGYMVAYGDQSWELDALEPRVLDRLIRDEVENLTDEDSRQLLIKQQESERNQLQKIADTWSN